MPAALSHRFAARILGLALALAGFVPVPAWSAATDAKSTFAYAADYDSLLAHLRDDNPAHALTLVRSALERSPDDSFLWHVRGDLASDQGQLAEATDAYRHALALGSQTRSMVAEDMARAFAKAGEKDSTLAWLERSVAWGNEHRPDLAGDSAFVAWFDDARFRAATGQLPDRQFARDEGWRYDLAFLVSEVKRMHYRYRAQALPSGFEAAASDLDRRIPGLSDGQVLMAMQRLLVRLSDGHSTLYPVSDRTGPWPTVPVRTYQFSDGVWIVDADSAHAGAIGRQVVAIEGTRIETVFERLAEIVPHDNPMGVRWMAPLFVSMPEVLVQLGVAKDAARVTYELVDHEGQSIPLVLTTGSATGGPHSHIPRLGPSKIQGAGPVPRWMAHADDPYWFGPLDDTTIVYLQFNQVTNARRERLREFAARLSAWVEAHDTKDLIVDVRHNNGGNGGLNVLLERALVRFEGKPGRKLWVLTGRSTFSAAQSFINDVERLTSATFAGEPSSSRPNFVGESTSFRLPWSGAIGSISTRYHSFRDADERIWIAPRLPLALSSGDYFANRDPALDAVVAAAQARRLPR